VDTFYVSAQCEYLGSARYEDIVYIETRVAEIGRSSVTCSFVVRDDQGEILAHATITSVCVDPKTRRSVPVPEAFRERIAEFQGEGVSMEPEC
jgi:YbgC/YbaW family acyl-CoA thioester hydrolase